MLVLAAALALADAPTEDASGDAMASAEENLCTPIIRRQVAPEFPKSQRGTGAECTISMELDAEGNPLQPEFVDDQCPVGFQPGTAAAASRFRFRLPNSCVYDPQDKPKYVVKFVFQPTGASGRAYQEQLTEAYIAQVVEAYANVEGPSDACHIGATVYANGAIAGLTRNMPQCLAVVHASSAPVGLQEATTCTLTAEVGNNRARKWDVSGCPEGIGQAALDVARGWDWHNPFSDRIPYEIALTFDPSSPE